MLSRLPEYCDLFQLAEKNATITGTWPVSKMPRLLGMLASDVGEATAELEFGKSGRTRFLRGKVLAEVTIQCQRCMQDMAYTLEAEFLLALLDDEIYIDKMPDQYEALITEGRHFLPDVIEDELILAVPIVANHESECSDFMNEQAIELEKLRKLEEEEKKKSNPFSVLKNLQ